MRVFFLGGKKSQEIPREHWESRRQDYGDPRYRELAIEIAPGVHAITLGWGDFILPDGSVSSGVQIAVWESPESPARWLLPGAVTCSCRVILSGVPAGQEGHRAGF